MAILLKGWILPIGGASSEECVRLQPAQQACITLVLPNQCLEKATFGTSLAFQMSMLRKK